MRCWDKDFQLKATLAVAEDKGGLYFMSDKGPMQMCGVKAVRTRSQSRSALALWPLLALTPAVQLTSVQPRARD